MTGYVVTRLYRAPEIMLTWQKYSAKVDIWSSACIIAEMLLGKPIFPATSHAEQFQQIVKLLGSPPSWIREMVTNSNVSLEWALILIWPVLRLKLNTRLTYIQTRGFIDCLPRCPRRSFADVFPNFDKEGMYIEISRSYMRMETTNRFKSQ